jgi:hypothetical protein
MARPHLLNDANSVALWHSQVQDHHVRSATIVQGDRGLAVTRLRDHLHIRLLIDHRSQPIAHGRVVICEHHTDSPSCHVGHQFFSSTTTGVLAGQVPLDPPAESLDASWLFGKSVGRI